MKFIQYRIGDIVQLKKKHPCGSQEWEVLQLGSDLRIKCRGCEHIAMIEPVSYTHLTLPTILLV